MTSINAVGALIFTNPAAQTRSPAAPAADSDSDGAAPSEIVPAQFAGEAFALSIGQQVGAGGSDEDSVLFESYGQTASGGYATVSMSTGNSFSSAFEAMLANFQDASPAITGGADETMQQMGQTADGLGGLLGQFAASLQNSNSDGTAGVGAEMLIPPAGSSAEGGTSSGNNLPGGGMTSFLGQIINSLEANLDAKAGANAATAQT